MSKAGNSQGSRSQRGKGKPFPKGTSGNPTGLSAELREKRKRVSDALDEALVVNGVDLLVESIVAGVKEREPSLVRLACEYRWGKPPVAVEIEPEQMADDELRSAIIELAEQLKQQSLTH